MYTCTACLRRTINGLVSDVQHSASSSHKATKFLLPRYTSPSQVRRHATLSSLSKSHHRSLAAHTLKKWKKKDELPLNKRRKAAFGLTDGEIRDAMARENNRANMIRQVEAEREVDEDEDEDETEEVDKRDVADEEEDDTLYDIRPSGSSEHATTKELIAQQKQEAAAEKRLARKAMLKAKDDVETYYRDPLELAHGVVQRLRSYDVQGALTLVRASDGFKVDNVVSWNHCMDFLMAQGEVKEAMKVYNEMKKRGHKPDAHTYTLLLRGFSQKISGPTGTTRTKRSNPKTKALVQDAVKVYNSIFAPNSAVKPNTIHTNAIINVCARGGDMESMWAVTARLPEQGPGSPDRLTYTTILNAITDNTIKGVAQLVEQSQQPNKEEIDFEAAKKLLYETALADGRKLWEDISFRWRRADLQIDEQLVVAMGRLLIGCGVGKDLEQVLALLDVTMNLRVREWRSRADAAQWLVHNPSLDSKDDPDSMGAMQTLQDQMEQSMTQLEAPSETTPAVHESSIYATPTNKTLAMILDAAQMHVGIRDHCRYYWVKLTDPTKKWRIQPDAGNIISYLRILRTTRASSEAYKLLAKDWPKDVRRSLYKRSTFLIAFSTCIRDKLNPNVFETARKLMTLMDERLEENAVTLFEERSALTNMDYATRQKALKKRRAAEAAELASQPLNAPETDELELTRRQDGVQSMTADPKALRYFLEIAVHTTPGWDEGIRGKDDGTEFTRNPAKNHTMLALSMIAPHTAELQRLLRLKLDEMHASDMPALMRQRSRVARGAGGDNTRVAEKIEELIALMRSMIGAYDRIVEIQDRFHKTKRPLVDGRLVKEYDAAKRQFNVYIARIDKTTRAKMLTTTAETDAALIGDAAVELGEEPAITQQVEALYEGVERDIGSVHAQRKLAKTQKKGFRQLEGPVLRGRRETPERTKMSSRRQARERENLVNERMGRVFPQTDYGVLDEEGNVRRRGERKEPRKQVEEGEKEEVGEGAASGWTPFDQSPILGREKVKSDWRWAKA